MKLVRSNHYFQKWQIDWMEANRKNTGTSAAELLKQTDVVLLAMKPQDFQGFALEHRSFFKPVSCDPGTLAKPCGFRLRRPDLNFFLSQTGTIMNFAPRGLM